VHTCGVHPDVATGDGTTPFHYAVWQGHMAVCKWLVYGAGADVASENEFGCNAIQWAAQTDDVGMCRWLAGLGLDLSIINHNGHSALHKAANKGQARSSRRRAPQLASLQPTLCLLLPPELPCWKLA
jgi:ankyrin repeat protein